MARTITEIKAELTSTYLANETIQKKYGLISDDKDNFETLFSPLSLESIFFYVVAVCMWTLEKLFDAHKAEVTNIIDTLKPHTLQWYVTKAKEFQYGGTLATDADYYEKAGKAIISFAAAVENNYTVYLKIAKVGSAGSEPLDDDEKNSFISYINRIKDAGVNLEVLSKKADVFFANITIYYDPMLLTSKGESASDGSKIIKNCIFNFIQNLPFNGELRIKALEDALSEVDGVVMPEVRNPAAKTADQDAPVKFTVSAYQKPYSGYFTIWGSDISVIASGGVFPDSYTEHTDASVFVKFVPYVTVQD